MGRPEGPARAGEGRGPFPELEAAFDAAVQRCLPIGGRCTVLYSSGVDSGLVAEAASRSGKPTLLTIGLPGSPDVTFARAVGPLPGVPHRIVEVEAGEIERARSRVLGLYADLSPVELSVMSALAVALARSPEPIVLCGQGADELFLGYAHFRGLPAGEAEARSTADLRALVERDGPRAGAIAKELGCELRSPFLDPAVVASARSIPIATRLPGATTKVPLREIARRRGLPDSVVERPKKALQFGTGIDRWLRTHPQRAD